KAAAFRKDGWAFDTIAPQHNFLFGNATGDEFGLFLFGCGDNRACPGEHFTAEEAMVHALQPKVAHARHKHADGLDNIGDFLLAAGGGHARAEHIVQPKNVHDFKFLQLCAQEAGQGGIPTCRAIVEPVVKINRRYARDFALPAKGIVLGVRFVWELLQPPVQSPVSGEHGYDMATSGEPFRKSAHFYGRTAKFEERRITLGDIQDSHSSRRIFLKAFAKTLKRNSL